MSLNSIFIFGKLLPDFYFETASGQNAEEIHALKTVLSNLFTFLVFLLN